MLVLRWLLGVAIVLMSGSLLTSFIAANAFRDFFGDAQIHPLLVILPILASAVLLAGLIFPRNKPLLHAGAAAVVGLAIFCTWLLITESALEVVIAFIGLALWLFYYWRTVFYRAG